MTELTGMVGFAFPIPAKTLSKYRNRAVELIATLVLAVCLVVAVTAVSIGMARAQALHAAILRCSSQSDGLRRTAADAPRLPSFEARFARTSG